LIKGEFRWSVHATLRAQERFVSELDIRCCARKGKAIFQPDRGTWKVSGQDEHGEKLIVICKYVAEVLIVTVY